MNKSSFVKRNLLFVFISFVMMIFSCSGVRGYEEGDVIPEEDYLTFTSEEDGSTINFSWFAGSNVRYQKNNGEWSAYESKEIIVLDKEEFVKFRGNAIQTSKSNENRFKITGKFSASGCVESLRLNSDGTFQGLLTPNESYTYSSMFMNCKGLITPPSLTCTTLIPYCYWSMFSGCTSLKRTPALPAKKLAPHCYQYMFNGCTSLEEAPALPSTELVSYGYSNMFAGCTSLKLSNEQSSEYPFEWKFRYSHEDGHNPFTSMFNGLNLNLTPDADGYATLYSAYPLVKETEPQQSNSLGNNSQAGNDSQVTHPLGSISQGDESRGNNPLGNDSQGDNSQSNNPQESDSQGNDSQEYYPQGADDRTEFNEEDSNEYQKSDLFEEFSGTKKRESSDSDYNYSASIETGLNYLLILFSSVGLSFVIMLFLRRRKIRLRRKTK